MSSQVVTIAVLPAAADIRISHRISVSRISAEKIRPAECLFPTMGLIANSKRSSLSADRWHKICFIHDGCKLTFERKISQYSGFNGKALCNVRVGR